jgi:hypothetical protein
MMKQMISWLAFLTFSAMVAAQKPVASSISSDPNILWEFDTGG